MSERCPHDCQLCREIEAAEDARLLLRPEYERLLKPLKGCTVAGFFGDADKFTFCCLVPKVAWSSGTGKKFPKLTVYSERFQSAGKQVDERAVLVGGKHHVRAVSEIVVQGYSGVRIDVGQGANLLGSVSLFDLPEDELERVQRRFWPEADL